MKRLSKKRKRYLDKRAWRIAHPRLKSKRPLHHTAKQKTQRGEYRVLHAPKLFTLYDKKYRKILLELIERMRTCLTRKNPIKIDFSGTERMHSCGTLLFFSELDRCREIAGSTLSVQCIPPKNQKVAQVLKQVGIFDLLNFTQAIEPTFDDVVHWRVAKGHEVDGEQFDNILGEYEGRVADALLSGLYVGISEAMTNCHQHAYIKTRKDGLGYKGTQKNWWMFSQQKDSGLSVVFCDLGVGIPETLPEQRPEIWEKIVSLGKTRHDGHIIKEAVCSPLSRTRQPHRGKGLRQLLDAAQKSNGQLRIYSNRGCYTSEKGNEHASRFRNSIMGTLIQWFVPMAQESFNDENH
jgi:hypothetical protein